MTLSRVKHLLLACAVALLTAVPAHAQSGSITGTVRGVGAAPIPGAVVQANTPAGGRVASTLSNQSGRFLLVNVPAGQYVVTVTMTGYETGRYEVGVAAGQTASVEANLVARAIDLDPVVVSASRRQERALDAPARVEVVGPQQIEERPAVQPVEHLRSISGVDIVQQGLQSTNVVARGFNNVFSGALLALTDHRIAAIPSLRVNALYMIPATNEDIERMEVVLGPGSALYGPNTANGVLHMFTRSPLNFQGTTVTATGGNQNVMHGTFRTSHLVNENLGVKLSGQLFRGDEWFHEDPVEEAARLRAPPGSRIGVRDFDARRWGLDGRVDWRVGPDATAIISGGRSTTERGLEMTGLGTAQIRDWSYDYVQGRFNWGRLFAQAYGNFSSAGSTYLLRDAADIIDDSRFYVAQIQHGFQPVNWQNFTYGVDWIRTQPETGGTIHGVFEDEDNFTESGVFLQSETALGQRLDLVLAGRLDQHSIIAGTVFSPRAALVFKAAENQTFRVSYNRAYSNPGSINLFLDLNAGPAGAAGPFGYNIRARGTGRTGFTFRQADGSYVIRSPFNPAGAAAMAPLSTASLWEMQIRGLAGILVQQGQLTAQQAQQQFIPFMLSQTPSAAQVGFLSNHPLTGLGAFTDIPDVPGIRESTTTSYEVGYKGILGGRLLLAADLWYNQRDNFISPLIPQNTFVLLNPQQAGAYAMPRFQAFLQAAGMPAAQAAATAQAMTQGFVQLPGGVVASPDVGTGGADLLVTYRNFGDINLWGTDLAATALLGRWTVGTGISLVSDDHFSTEGQIITLNAPKSKLNGSLAYRDPTLGFNGELRVRHHGGFPVNSGVFIGVECIIPGAEGEACVPSATLTDLTLGYRLPQVRGASLQLSVTNLFDHAYQSFIGTPQIGRMALLRLRYDF
jgi:outer membrane receptor for ferrienterochelin and colicins